MFKALLTGLLLFIIIPSAFAQGDVSKGKTLIGACTACHGADGNSQIALFPKLAGQKENYLFKQLKDIQNGKRNVPQMTGLLASFNQQDLSNIAAYFAQQKTTIGKAKPNLVEQGGTLFRFGDPKQAIPACASCHGPAGQGNNSASYPALSGQHAQYTLAQLQAFAQSKRTNDPHGMMQKIAQKMNKKQIDAVADYLQGLKEAH